MSRRVDLSPKDIRNIERLARYLTQEQIADVLEVSSRTLRNRLKDDPRALAGYKRGKGKTIAAIARSLIFKALSGDTACMIFFLKCQAGWRETDPRQIPVEDLNKLTDREIEAEKKRVGMRIAK